MAGLPLKPGEIRLDLIPSDWPLTPLGADKNPYLAGWQNLALSVGEVSEHVYAGSARAIGLISGPVGNGSYGLVWVDVDGSTVHSLIEEMSGGTFSAALPKTLSICSGRTGRVRKLYRIPRDKIEVFARNKYVWLSPEGEKLEVLFAKKQGVLMGKHPDTKGYFTPEGEGFEHAKNLPELPEWLEAHIVAKNKKQGGTTLERNRYVGTTFAINAEMSIERDVRIAEQALFALPQEHCDDYDCWISAGQALHSIDDSCLELWELWSQRSANYEPGVCAKKWHTFDREGGKGLGSLIEEAKRYGFTVPQDHKVHAPDDDEVEAAAAKVALLDEPIDENYTLEEDMPLRSDPPILDMGVSAKPKRPRKSRNDGIAYNELVEGVENFYSGNLAYDEKGARWMEFRPVYGVWEPISDQVMGRGLQEILGQLVESGLIKSWTKKMCDDLKSSLSERFAHKDWYEGSEYLVFSNGVLHTPAMMFWPIDSGNIKTIRKLRLIHRQPYPYLKDAECKRIKEWLAWTQHGKEDRVQLLRAFLRAVLLQASHLQRFLEIVGYGRTGKSTFANLCVALVGKQNIASTHFKEMESNKFELTNFFGKKLIVLADQDRYGGSVSQLKALTGGDMIRNEVKYKASVENFQYRGMVIVTANAEIQSNDKTTGLQRRRITLYFNRVYKGQGEVLIDFNTIGQPEGAFAKELPGLINWLLEMTDEEMTNYIRHTDTYVKGYKDESSERDRKVSPIHDWMNENLMFDPDHWCAIGKKKKKPFGQEGTHSYPNWDSELYPSYLEHTEGTGNKPVTLSNFMSTLIEVCETNELPIYKEIVNRKSGIHGLRLRRESAHNKRQDLLPSIVDYMNDKNKYRSLYES